MTRIKGYLRFLEDLQVSANDSPVARMAKQAVNSDSEYLEDYNAKKQKLVDLFTSTDANGQFKYDDESLKVELEKEMGRDAEKSGKDRNPLLQELTVVLDLQRQIARLDRQNLEDKRRMDEQADEQADEEGPRKAELGKRVEDAKAKVAENTSRIAALSKKAADSKKAFDKKMADFMKNVKASTDEIKKTPPK